MTTVERAQYYNGRQFFRGISEKTGEMRYGRFVLNNQKAYIIYWMEIPMEFREKDIVDIKTVGQFTGMNDSNNHRIFTGDYLLDTEDVVGGQVGFCYGSYELLILPELVGLPLTDIDRKYNPVESQEAGHTHEEKCELDRQLKEFRVVSKREFETLTGYID